MTNTEPQGIKDIREAKADYLESLAKVKDATAELVKAQAAYQDALTAYQQAVAKEKEIANTIAQAKADAEIAKVKADAEKAAVDAQKALAIAQEELRLKLREIALAAMTLTNAERTAIATAAWLYNDKLSAYNTAYNNLVEKQKELWIAEYDESVAPTDTGYMETIAYYEAEIALAELKIATTEGLLEEPQEVKDSIEAWKERIKDLQIDSVNAVNAKNLYEATVLKDANRAYDAARAAYVKDSVPAGVAFKFEKDYPLTTGKGLDEKFKVYVNGTGAPAKGIKVADDAKKIVVKNVGTNEKVLDTAIACVGEVIDALNRELVVVNNKVMDEAVAGLEKAAVAADSIYTDHRAILEKGLKEYAPYKAANDTVEVYKGYLELAQVADSVAQDAVDADTVAVKAAIGDAAAEYIAANKAFAEVVNHIRPHQEGGNFDHFDSTAFIAAVIALGNAQANYLGAQDSLIQYYADNFTVDSTKYALSELVPAGFVAKETYEGGQVKTATSLYGGSGYGAFAEQDLSKPLQEKAYYIWNKEAKGPDAFARVIRIVTGKTNWGWKSDINPSDVALIPGGYNSEKGWAYNLESLKTAKDSINWYLETVKDVDEIGDEIVDAFDSLEEDNETKAETAEAVVEAQEVVDAKLVKVAEAKKAYYDIYASFFGYDKESTEWHKLTEPTVEAAQTLPYTAKTFTTPTNCVKFVFSEETSKTTIINNAVLYTVLMQIDPDSAGDANKSTIFVGPDKHTEFTAKLYAEQLAEYAKDYKNNEQQLKNINEQFTALKADVVAKEAEVKKANEAHDAAMLKLIGKDGKAVLGLADSCVTNGKWNLKGLQKEWAEQFAPEYPEICADVAFAQKNLKNMIEEANNFIKVLDECYTAYTKIVTGEDDANLSAIITRLKGVITTQEANIKYFEGQIALLEKALAQYKAGFDTKQIQLETLQQEIDALTKKLTQAAEELEIAKKEYEDIIKKYGVNE